MHQIKTLLCSKEFRRYLITGFTAFGIEYLLYLLLYRGFGMDYALASVIVYFTVFAVTFIVTRNWTFESDGAIRRQFVMHLALFLFNLVVGSYFLLRFLVGIGIPATVAPILKMGMITCWNFLLFRYVIYKK